MSYLLEAEYKSLSKLQGDVLYWYGQENIDGVDYIVMITEMVGLNLRDLFIHCGQEFKVLTVVTLAIKMIQAVQALHSKRMIHKCISPEAFVFGVEDKSHTLMLTNLFNSTPYQYSFTKNHIPYSEDVVLKSYSIYSSLNVLAGVEPSRRDDLEALGYVLISFLKRRMPLFKKSTAALHPDNIYDKKVSVPLEVLCDGLPIEFSLYMRYVTTLGFEEKPDYDYLCRLFAKIHRQIKNKDGTPDLQWLKSDNALETEMYESEKSHLKYFKQLNIESRIDSPGGQMAPFVHLKETFPPEAEVILKPLDMSLDMP